MAATITLDFSPYKAWSLAATLRSISGTGGASRIELKPASPFSGDPEFDSSSLSAWTQANSANASTIDANTTQKGKLYIRCNATNTDWSGATQTAPFVNQTLSGDRDIYGQVQVGDGRDFHNVRLGAQSTSNANHWINFGFISISAGLGTRNPGLWKRNTVNSVSTDSAIDFATGSNLLGGLVWLRIKRVTNDFSGYYSLDGGLNWTQISTTQTRSDFSADAKYGLIVAPANTANACSGSCDFLRTWPPYDTGTPLASLVLDSGFAGTTWTMSTFQDVVNPLMEYAPYSQIGFGTITYDYGASDSNPPSLTGSYYSTATMQGKSNPSGRYFKLSAKFTATNGYEMTSFCGATINGSVSLPRVGVNQSPLVAV